MAVNDNFEVKITSTYQGDVMQNVLHYQQTAGSGGITEVCGKLADAIRDTLLPIIRAAQTNKVDYQTIRVQQVGVPEPTIVKIGLVAAGLSADPPLPAQDAVLFVKRCNNGGRKNVGKFYLSGIPEDWADGGLVNVGTDELEAIAEQIKGNLTIESFTFAPGIWHRTEQSIEFITRCEIRPQISRQKRRHIPVL